MSANGTDEITSNDDILDSRDIIERIEYLESEFDDIEITVENGAREQLDDDGNVIDEPVTCGTCGREWNDALITSRTPAPSARCPYEDLHDELAELDALRELASEAEGYSEDWKYGATLICDSYFVEYAQELADDIGAVNADADWPMCHIDWEAAADDLKQDYTSVSFDGVDYWVR
jgi:hypothetical protein